MFRFLKLHIVEYYLFYILAYVLVTPIWLNVMASFLYKNINLIPLMLSVYMGTTLILGAGGIKHYYPNLKFLSKVLFTIGLLVQAIFLIKLVEPALHSITVTLALSMSLMLAILWIVIYVIDLSSLDKEKNRLIGKNVFRYFIFCVVLLYAPVVLLSKYYSNQINKILSKGSLNVAGSSDSTQIEKMIDEKIWQAQEFTLLLMILVLLLFSYFYRRVTNVASGSD
jgi:hypothetical protein